jgi:hypothetical protein
MAQMVNHWPLTSEAGDRIQVSPSGISGGQCGIEAGFY